jgi:hypothetical protein
MPDPAQLLLRATLIGAAATAVMDFWSLMQKHGFGLKTLDYGLVGRWLAYIPRGRFHHHPIGSTPEVRGEKVLGWAAHYATGVSFAVLLLCIFGTEWTLRPTPVPALAVGVGSIVFPFFILQPAFGLGVASNRAPNPMRARFRSLVSHLTFAMGLYLAALATARVWTDG